jgi:hypothetical protein
VVVHVFGCELWTRREMQGRGFAAAHARSKKAKDGAPGGDDQKVTSGQATSVPNSIRLPGGNYEINRCALAVNLPIFCILPARNWNSLNL